MCAYVLGIREGRKNIIIIIKREKRNTFTLKARPNGSYSSWINTHASQPRKTPQQLCIKEIKKEKPSSSSAVALYDAFARAMD